MAEILKKAVFKNVYFWIFSGVAIALLIGSFFCPPVGIINESVLMATGELFGFAALGTVIKAIDKGVDAKVKHNNTEVELNNPEKN